MSEESKLEELKTDWNCLARHSALSLSEMVNWSLMLKIGILVFLDLRKAPIYWNLDLRSLNFEISLFLKNREIYLSIFCCVRMYFSRIAGLLIFFHKRFLYEIIFWICFGNLAKSLLIFFSGIKLWIIWWMISKNKVYWESTSVQFKNKVFQFKAIRILLIWL